MSVLTGAINLLKENKICAIIFETNPNDSKIRELLESYGFCFYYLVRNSSTLVANQTDYPVDKKSCLNILAIKSQYAKQLEMSLGD